MPRPGRRTPRGYDVNLVAAESFGGVRVGSLITVSRNAQDVERSSDARYVVIAGRRWRATDPGIPEPLRTELVAELMAARRAVRCEGDSARHRVGDAKVVLGERGEAWWEDSTRQGRAARMSAAYRVLLRHRPTGTVCPSEVSRIVGGEGWRSFSRESREVAWDLADQGITVVLQKGEAAARGARGPIRVGRGSSFDA